MGYDMTIARNRDVLMTEKPKEAARQVLSSMRNLFDVQRERGAFENTEDVQRYLRITNDLETYCERILDPGYFRLNIFGMGRYMDAMAEVGMLYEAEYHNPDWESLPDPAVVGEEAYLAALDKLTAYAGPLPEYGIASFKFSSNDGWLVTAEECARALESWKLYQESQENTGSERTQDIITSDYWQEWLQFLKLASKNGGFRVF